MALSCRDAERNGHNGKLLPRSLTSIPAIQAFRSSFVSLQAGLPKQFITIFFPTAVDAGFLVDCNAYQVMCCCSISGAMLSLATRPPGLALTKLLQRCSILLAGCTPSTGRGSCTMRWASATEVHPCGRCSGEKGDWCG